MLLNKTKEILCPRCEQAMNEHVDGDCPKRRVSRRFFMGLLGSAAASVMATKAFSNLEVKAPDNPEQLIVEAAPKIHVRGAFHLRGTPAAFFTDDLPHTLDDIQRQITQLAEKETRTVVATVWLPMERREVILAGYPELKAVRHLRKVRTQS